MKTEILVPLLLIAVFTASLWVLPTVALCVSTCRKFLAALARMKTGRRFQMPSFAWEHNAVGERWERFGESWKGMALFVIILVASILGLIYDKP